MSEILNLINNRYYLTFSENENNKSILINGYTFNKFNNLINSLKDSKPNEKEFIQFDNENENNVICNVSYNTLFKILNNKKITINDFSFERDIKNYLNLFYTNSNFLINDTSLIKHEENYKLVLNNKLDINNDIGLLNNKSFSENKSINTVIEKDLKSIKGKSPIVNINNLTNSVRKIENKVFLNSNDSI